MNFLKNIFRMAMVAFAAIAVTACEPNNGAEDDNTGNGDNTETVQPTALYAEWMGVWVINGDNKIANDVVISAKEVNKSIELTGLMGLPFSIVGEYSTERNDIIFSAQVVEKEYEFNGGEVGEIQLLGLDRDNKYYGIDKNGNYEIAIAGVIDGGQRAIVRYGVNQVGYPKFMAMFLTAKIGDKYYDIGNDIPTFRAIATIDAPATASGVTPAQLSLGREITHLVH